MEWLTEYSASMDENEKMFSDFGSLKQYLEVPKDNFLFLYPNDKIAALRASCFIQKLIEGLDFKELNIVMWVASEMDYTTESGPWTKTLYCDNEEKTFRSVRELAEHLKLPAENVLFLVPGDEFLKDKIGEYVSHFFYKFKWSHHTAITWFKCKDYYPSRLLKRIF